MLKVDSLVNWRKAASGMQMAYHGDLPRTEVVKVRSSGPVNVIYIPISGDGEVAEEDAMYIGTLGGDDAIRVTAPGGFLLQFEFAKTVAVTVYDDREAFASPSPDTEIFTIFEKRGLESLDPLDIITHRQNVTARLQRIADGPERRDREHRESELMAEMRRMAKRLEQLEGPKNEEAQDSAGPDNGGEGEK